MLSEPELFLTPQHLHPDSSLVLVGPTGAAYTMSSSQTRWWASIGTEDTAMDYMTSYFCAWTWPPAMCRANARPAPGPGPQASQPPAPSVPSYLKRRSLTLTHNLKLWLKANVNSNKRVKHLPWFFPSLFFIWASLMAQLVKNLPAVWETWVWSLGWEDSLEKGKATHCSILAWKIP